MQKAEAEFIHQLTNSQTRLLGYLVSLLGSVHDARDVLQATNVALWEKRVEFRAGADFGPWARKFAYFQSLAFIRDRKRDRHVFDDDLLAQLAEDEMPSWDEDVRDLALRDCLSQLPENQRKLIKYRYDDGGSIAEVVKKSGKKASAVKVMLMRIRKGLLVCIKSKIEVCDT